MTMLRIGKEIYDETCERLANSDIKPAIVHPSINQAKRHMLGRPLQQKRAFASHKAMRAAGFTISGLLDLPPPSGGA